jgi:protein O-GlcNAc transferase
MTDAMAGYQEATRLDPSFFEAHYNLGLAAYDMRDFGLSLSAYERALSINATSADARFNFAFALQEANFPEDAARELERILAARPDEARAHFAVAKLYAEPLARVDLARAHYRKVLQLDPQHPQATAIRYWLSDHP